MAIILYDLAIGCFRWLLWLISPIHDKARKMIAGRKHWQTKLQSDMQRFTEPVVWFHCASLGEFEQGRPIIDAFRSSYPGYRILLTFYSPSGYEIRKNYAKVDAVHYLPWDTASNAREFYEIVNPAAGFIIKYEFWYHLMTKAKRKQIPVAVCAAIFRKSQIFFRPWGGLFRDILKSLHHIFVQDTVSKELLQAIDVSAVTVAGDTRIDRVAAITADMESNKIVERFLNGDKAFIVGSSWPKDLEVLAPLINSVTSMKFIVAPHEINQAHLDQLFSIIDRPLTRYTRYSDSTPSEVMVIDTIGILSSIYRYGKYAYIGGAFGKGLHNILEAATFGLPLFFGNRNYTRFAEARALVKLGAAHAIADVHELETAFINLENDPSNYKKASATCRQYIELHTGATQKIMNKVGPMLVKE